MTDPACARKVRYSTYELAVAAAIRCVEGMRTKPQQMQPYRCPTCRGWHNTSHPRRDVLPRFPAIEAQK